MTKTPLLLDNDTFRRNDIATMLNWLFIIFLTIATIFTATSRGPVSYSTLRAPLTPKNQSLLNLIASIVLLPWTVLLSLAVGTLTSAVLNHKITAWDFSLFWANLTSSGAQPIERIAVISLSELSPVLIAACLLAIIVLRKPQSSSVNFLFVQSARFIVFTKLILHPALALVLQKGQLWELRTLANTEATGTGDLILLAMFVSGGLLWQKTKSGAWKSWILLHASPLTDLIQRARKDLQQEPSHPASLRLITEVALLHNKPEFAEDQLTLATDACPEQALAPYLLGLLQLQNNAPTDASQSLRIAGERIEQHNDEGLRKDVIRALAVARMKSGDTEGALLTLEELFKHAPDDVAGMLVQADLFVKQGSIHAARTALEKALVVSRGALAYEIRKKIETLPSRALG